MKTTIKQLWPFALGMIVIVIIMGLTGCDGSYSRYSAAQRASNAFLQGCSNSTIQYSVSTQNEINTLTMTCKHE